MLTLRPKPIYRRISGSEVAVTASWVRDQTTFETVTDFSSLADA
jgi:hypothetical protein